MPKQTNDESVDADHKECVSPDDELCRCIDAVVDQLRLGAEEEPSLGGLSATERWRREEAVKQANASLFLEGFCPSKEAQDRARHFINGEIDLPTLTQATSNSKSTRNSLDDDG
ncbi:antitoxin VbhA family protein [Massilia sp. UMI-21]|nr:antitoxin VbhA family protein [Massilia sp. UMI-21]